MKIEFTSNIRKEDEYKLTRWFKKFAEILLMDEDETLVDFKIDGENFNLYQ